MTYLAVLYMLFSKLLIDVIAHLFPGERYDGPPFHQIPLYLIVSL